MPWKTRSLPHFPHFRHQIVWRTTAQSVMFELSSRAFLHRGEPRSLHPFFEKRNSMKKVLATGLLAICAIALSQQQASAWVNARFGIGFNWGWQSGGNNVLWGAWKNGQPPGPEMFHGGPFTPYGPAYPPQNYGHHHHSYAPLPYGSYEMPMQQPSYAMPMQYAPLYQYATYPRYNYYDSYYYGR